MMLLISRKMNSGEFSVIPKKDGMNLFPTRKMLIGIYDYAYAYFVMKIVLSFSCSERTETGNVENTNCIYHVKQRIALLSSY